MIFEVALIIGLIFAQSLFRNKVKPREDQENPTPQNNKIKVDPNHGIQGILQMDWEYKGGN